MTATDQTSYDLYMSRLEGLLIFSFLVGAIVAIFQAVRFWFG